MTSPCPTALALSSVCTLFLLVTCLGGVQSQTKRTQDVIEEMYKDRNIELRDLEYREDDPNARLLYAWQARERELEEFYRNVPEYSDAEPDSNTDAQERYEMTKLEVEDLDHVDRLERRSIWARRRRRRTLDKFLKRLARQELLGDVGNGASDEDSEDDEDEYMREEGQGQAKSKRKRHAMSNDGGIGEDSEEEEDEFQLEEGEGQAKSRRKRIVMSNENKIWTGGVVPYLFEDGIQETLGPGIHRAMGVFERFTCLRFIPWHNATEENNRTTNQIENLDHPSFLRFVTKSGCWADQGNTRNPRGQEIACCGGTTCVHEIGHAMGSYHEHQNPAGRGIVRLNKENALPKNQFTFEYAPLANEFHTGFDFQSVMHYGNRVWSANGSETISYLFYDVPPGDDYFYLMQELSITHKCAELKCSSFSMKCENDGYVAPIDGVCRCRCPIGLDSDSGCTKILKKIPADRRFPAGSYALPQASMGCPPNDGFLTGDLTHFGESYPCADNNNQCNYWARIGECESNPNYMRLNCKDSCGQCFRTKSFTSDSYNLNGTVDGSTVQHTFCVKNEEGVEGNWPAGEYCIYRKGGKCPKGFTDGSVQVFDISNFTSFHNGALPDGTFDNNTLFEFCCRMDGFRSDPLYFPTDTPFALFHHDKQKCPEVEGMRSSEEYIVFNSIAPAIVTGVVPVSNHSVAEDQYFFKHCYYTPVRMDCGKIYNLSPTSPEVTFSAPRRTNQRCTWLFKAPEGTRLMLNFGEFKIYKEKDECYDKVDLRYDRMGQTPVSYCGDSFAKTVSTVFNTLMITFETKDKLQSKFSATVSLVYTGNMCYKEEDEGATYDGNVNFTRAFNSCIPWHEAAECLHSSYKYSDVMDSLVGNKCRNPGDGLRPWCYTDADGCHREYCDVCQIENRFDMQKECDILDEMGMCTHDPRASALCASTCGTLLPTFPEPPLVTTVTCGQPPYQLPGGKLTENRKESYEVGETVTYMCGDNANRTQVRRCLTSGKWEPLNYVCQECATDWDLYNGWCFKYFSVPLMHAEAEAACADLGGVLAAARTEEENDYVSSLRFQFLEIWLGLSDREEEGEWKWSDGSELSFSNWLEGQPDNYYNEDCVMMKGNKKWNDASCRFYRKPYVCMHKEYSLGDQECKDFVRHCPTWHYDDPASCEDQPRYMKRYCKQSCGLCPNPKVCPVDQPTENAILLGGATEVIQGQTVTYDCKPGFVPSSGDAVRGCQECGKMTGEALYCVDERSLEVVMDSPPLEKAKMPGTSLHSFTGNVHYLRIPVDGKIARWEFYSNGPGSGALQVWRPSGQPGNYTYQFIGQNKMKTVTDFQVNFYVEEADRIEVATGDMIGIYYGASNAGIGYTQCNATLMPEYLNMTYLKMENVDDFHKDQHYEFSEVAESTACRLYTFRAVVLPN